MPANVFAERFGIRPSTAFGMSVGGATGLAMVAQAASLVESGAARHVLVVAGEDRASGLTREESTKVLAQVGHAPLRGPAGRDCPRVLRAPAVQTPVELRARPPRDALAALPVQMRTHAGRKLGAHFQKPITIDDVLDLSAGGGTPQAPGLLPGLRRRCRLRRLGRPHLSDRSLVVAGIGQAHRTPAPVHTWRRRTRAPLLRRSEPSRRRTSRGTPSTCTGSTTASPSPSRCCWRKSWDLTPPGRPGAYASAGAFEVARSLSDEHTWRASLLRALRCGRRHGSSRRGGLAAAAPSGAPARSPRAGRAMSTRMGACSRRTSVWC